MKTVGMITIGQTPRDDLMPQFRSLLGPGFRLAEAGALDGLSHAEVQACIDSLADEADLLVVLCTGHFPPFRSHRPVLEPGRILFASLQAVFSGGTLGVLMPIPEQMEGAAARWSEISPRLSIEAESPYHGEAGLRAAAERFKAAGASMVVVDCMGFTEDKKAVLREVTGAPVLLPSSLLARFIAEVA